MRAKTNKNNPPQRRSRYRQGYFRPKNPQKYIGDPAKIIFRSSWERLFCEYCDQTVEIVAWSSEPVGIPYVSPVDGKEHSYFVDFYMKIQKPEETTEYLVEIKPSKVLNPPVMKEGLVTIKKLNAFNQAAREWLINKAKFSAAQDFADKTNRKFIVVTEEFLFKRVKPQ